MAITTSVKDDSVKVDKNEKTNQSAPNAGKKGAVNVGHDPGHNSKNHEDPTPSTGGGGGGGGGGQNTTTPPVGTNVQNGPHGGSKGGGKGESNGGADTEGGGPPPRPPSKGALRPAIAGEEKQRDYLPTNRPNDASGQHEHHVKRGVPITINDYLRSTLFTTDISHRLSDSKWGSQARGVYSSGGKAKKGAYTSKRSYFDSRASS